MSTPPDQLPPIPATPDLFIPQVPFKQLPFPWNDLTNTPQPDATQYYPDHAPSVVATLAGMHPTDQQGQTIKTDGNHALLVNNVGSGGSVNTGISIIHETLTEHTWNSRDAGLDVVVSNWAYDITAPYIFGCAYSLTFVVGASDPSTDSYIQLCGDNNLDAGRFINLWGYSSFGGTDLPVGTVVTVQDSIIFPQPIHAIDSWPNSRLAQIVGNCGREVFLGSGSIYGGEFK